MSRYLSSLGWRKDSLYSVPKRYVVEGRFETNGAAAAINFVGQGVASVVYSATGVYTLTFNQAFKHLVLADAKLAGAANSNDEVVPILASFVPGDANTPASLQFVTQSADGTAADLDGPVVMFKVVFSNENVLAAPTLS